MMPFIHIGHFTVPTAAFLFLVAFVAGLAVVSRPLAREIGWLKSASMVILTALSGILGGRILHVIWERPAHFSQHPEEILTQLDGLVFYGAFAASILAFHFMSRAFLQTRGSRDRAWDLVSIGAAISIGILRLACFADGCCWGKPTALPWAVRFYNPESLMPWLGIPVHPVQLYESVLGFSIAAALACFFRRDQLQGNLLYALFLSYGIGRWYLETFRGDSFRGVDLALGMSTSQIISLAFIGFAVVKLGTRPSKKLSGARV
jgi:phosphatidylglycerol---prolipoprotein diacylglyceryl transferase